MTVLKDGHARQRLGNRYTALSLMLFRDNNNPVVQNWMAKIGICKRRIRTSAELSSRVLQLNLNYCRFGNFRVTFIRDLFISELLTSSWICGRVFDYLK